jgi:hypothetical protein
VPTKAVGIRWDEQAINPGTTAMNIHSIIGRIEGIVMTITARSARLKLLHTLLDILALLRGTEAGVFSPWNPKDGQVSIFE